MEVPHVDGWKVKSQVGAGVNGQVFLAETEDGRLVVVKVYEESAIQRELLEKTTERLEAGGWPEGVMPVISADFRGFPPIRVSDWVGRIEDEVFLPASLHHHFSEHAGPQSKSLILDLARALAAMHGRGVAHGNLKPGNVFFNPAGGLLLTDWSLGNIPGGAQRDFTDALLYQAPDQLLHPEEYGTAAGYQWDVYAFGVLAFRLLTRVFPRCDDTFRLVVPEDGAPVREGIHAEVAKISKRLESHAEVVWPHEAADREEELVREWIGRCLELDPTLRPKTMMEVVAGLEAVVPVQAAMAEREVLLDQRRAAGHRASRAYFLAGAGMAGAALFGGLWQLGNTQVKQERATRAADEVVLRAELDEAMAAKNAAQTAEKEAAEALAYERDLAKSRLTTANLVTDRLFAWAMEKGHRRLPPLDGREQRLKKLERHLMEVLERGGNDPEMAEDRARVRLQIAEIALASGDPTVAAERLTEAMEAWKDRKMEPEMRMRVAENQLLLALLMQTSGDERTDGAFAAAREALVNLPQSEVDSDRLNQLLAILDFHEAKLLAARGEDAAALEQLMRATETLNRLADQRPDTVVLRSELAACYLSSATILEGIGALGDARGARALAAGELEKLIKDAPEDIKMRLELAGSYGAMAESAILSGDLDGADGFAQEAMGHLAKVIREQPENAEAVARMAAQLGLRAGIMRDMGRTKEAMQTFEEGIRMIEGVRASDPGNPTVAYQLALLGWHKGRMVGNSGDRVEEIKYLRSSRELLMLLESKPHPSGPPLDQLQRSRAYLQGDLGHATQLAGAMEESRVAFAEAVELWQALVKARPQSEEYEEGLAWCRQRLKELE